MSSKASEIQGSPSKANTSSKGVEQVKDTSKTGDVNKEVFQGSDLPPTAPKDPSKEKVDEAKGHRVNPKAKDVPPSQPKQKEDSPAEA